MGSLQESESEQQLSGSEASMVICDAAVSPRQRVPLRPIYGMPSRPIPRVPLGPTHDMPLRPRYDNPLKRKCVCPGNDNLPLHLPNARRYHSPERHLAKRPRLDRRSMRIGGRENTNSYSKDFAGSSRRQEGYNAEPNPVRHDETFTVQIVQSGHGQEVVDITCHPGIELVIEIPCMGQNSTISNSRRQRHCRRRHRRLNRNKEMHLMRRRSFP